jgi:hypothetical protein
MPLSQSIAQDTRITALLHIARMQKSFSGFPKSFWQRLRNHISHADGDEYYDVDKEQYQ